MKVFAMDPDGRLVGLMSEATAEKVVAAGRAVWVGVNVVQFTKRLKKPDRVPIDPNGIVPLPGSVRPQLVNRDGKIDVLIDLAEDPQGDHVKETEDRCWAAAKKACAASRMPGLLAGIGYGEMAQALRLGEGERPLFRGQTTPTPRQKSKPQAGPVSTIIGALPPIPSFRPADIGAGLTGQARKNARQRAFRELSELWRELREYFGMPLWGAKVGEGRYMNRWDLLEQINNLIWQLWEGSESFNEIFWKYRIRLEDIVTQSQSAIKPDTAAV